MIKKNYLISISLIILFQFLLAKYSFAYNWNNDDNFNTLVKNDFYYEIIQSSWHNDGHKEKTKKRKEERKRKRKEAARKVGIIKDFITDKDFNSCLRELIIGPRYDSDQVNKMIDESVNGNNIYIKKLSRFEVDKCLPAIAS